MSALPDLIQRLRSRLDLSPAEVAQAASALAAEAEDQALKEAFLEALTDKGESVTEVASFAREFRSRAVDPGVQAWAPGAIDIVGTGGDHAGGFNISSLVVLTLACCDVKVMKHGNRGITSKCGSADLLAGFGFRLEAPPETMRKALQHLGYVFFFAPAYHPSFKNIGPARKALASRGKRSVFNILGPLINPGRPGNLLLGVFSEAWVPKLAAALDELGVAAGIAAHGRLGPDKGIDELTSATPNRVKGFGRIRELDTIWTPESLGVASSPFSDLLGGDLEANLALASALIAGKGPKGLEDTIALNAAVGLWICGKTSTIKEGLAPARAALVGGAVARKISETREFFSQ